MRPAALKSLPLTVYLADGQRLISGGRQSTVKGDLNQLDNWNASAADINFYTPDGESRAVVFLPGSMQKQESFKETGRRSEYHVSFLLAEVG